MKPLLKLYHLNDNKKYFYENKNCLFYRMFILKPPHA